ncbi:inverse autotransporter beta domain-containing protein [Xenorhabdus sp. 18]|uniref:inverse autotransporter beta domain-containing protein n=1 Tax=Xenorhabdus doucetiae TaxID=351671 RepID=UPI0019A3C5B8|nr:inverse autotransporter beta domain-containing protein [Xenorhabdus sp. 18]MBD2796873.1 inverse autotransporter beta domain-containing protein [Xenorhabdus sp. 18]
MILSLLLPSSITNATADGNIDAGRVYPQEIDNTDTRISDSNKNRKNNQDSDSDTLNAIARNIQAASNILSSSPSELTEQAKSYALGKLNSTVASETQKWLSQFGTARINFGLDRKGTLENNSLDLLLPFYDNKADWLFFSQLGYRNKDSRNTINVGLGGRYFYQDWMYGLNTFYDYDLTGKNQRLGLGGEIWGDYIKFSANSYYRLSNWQHSRNFKDFHERPANGYDINGEFFLPVYPNLGAKLAYEQYFGDNVTLFNRDTKQKNPSLAKLGLTYTPVPLFTLGVDYKQGGSGHSETQFLANLSYKLGVPLSAQLSPDNVASMRTLAGSRYDLVERNNNIVLDHQKIPTVQLSLPETITGYSQEPHDITVKLFSNTAVKQIHWATNEDFAKHGGKLSSRVGNTITVTLPKYLSGDNQNNNYPIYALAELENNQKSAPVEMRVIVRPFMLQKREEANFTPAGPLPATGEKKDGYTFNPVITFDTANHKPIQNATISQVQWLTDPKTGPDSGLQFIDWEQSDTVEIDENGHFKRKPVLTSTQPHKSVKVSLQLDAQPPQFVGEVSFGEKPAGFHVDKVTVSPAVPSLIANGTHTYTYGAVIRDANNNPVKNQKVANVNWSKDKDQTGLIWHPSNGEVTTDDEGILTTTLASTVEIKDVTVSLAIGNQKPVLAEQSVSFTAESADTQDYHIDGEIQVNPSGTLTADGQQKYTYTAVIVGGDGKPVQNKKLTNAFWKIENPPEISEFNLDQSDKEIKGDGKLTATLTSNKAFNGVVVSLTVGSHFVQAKPVDFKPEQISPINVQPTKSILVNESYTLTVTVKDATGQKLESGKTVNWTIIDAPHKEAVTLDPATSTSNTNGEAVTKLTSTQVQKVTVKASIDGVGAQETTVDFTSPPVDFEINSVELYGVDRKGTWKEDPTDPLEKFDPSNPLTGDGKGRYIYRAKISYKGSQGTKILDKYTFTNVQWTREIQIDKTDLPEPKPVSLKTDDKGYLYATLDSHVGVYKDIAVTLTIPTQKGGNEIQKTNKDNSVTFAAVSQPAVLYVYNQFNPSVNKTFSEPGPYNYFPSLYAELRDPKSKDKSFDQNETSYTYKDKHSRYLDFFLPNNDKAPLAVHGRGKITFVANIKKPDGKLFLYEYKLNIQRYIKQIDSDHKYHSTNDGISCITPAASGNSGLPDITIEDLKSSYGPTTVTAEFNNLFKWGLFNNAKVTQEDEAKIKVQVGIDQDKKPIFNIYDVATNTIDTDLQSKGLLVCKDILPPLQ